MGNQEVIMEEDIEDRASEDDEEGDIVNEGGSDCPTIRLTREEKSRSAGHGGRHSSSNSWVGALRTTCCPGR